MPRFKTSESDPIRIVAVQATSGHGRIGITFCPGKYQPDAMNGPWDRSLDRDLDAIARWGATALVSLITDREIEALRVPRLPEGVRERHMGWWHLPIPDAHAPQADFEASWAAAGDALRDRLRCGFDVLVHCNGGLGRAGTVAARLLVELGVDPEDAIGRVRRARRGAIEVSDQEAHVRRCTSREPRDAAPVAAHAIEDRALGAFLGLAVGDALGTTLEFSGRDTLPPVTGMVGGGPFHLAPGEWTDDTSMALALADSLAFAEAFDARDVMDRFVRWWKQGEYSCTGRCFGIGNTTSRALDRYFRTGEPFVGASAPGTAGNGSLMRLAPVALRFFTDRARMDEVAAQQSLTTHAAPEAVDACRGFAGLLSDAIAGRPRAALFAPRRLEGAAGAVAEILSGSWRGRSRASIRSSGYVVHTMEAAMWAVARTANFPSAVLLAANLADDADTVAAVTVQLAGALYGLGGIPPAWLEHLAWRDRLLDAARRLLPAGIDGANPRPRAVPP